MNSFIETLNRWGENFLNFAWPMFWQSSLLIVVLFALDFLFRRKIRASIRYSLWLVVLLKLILPPTLALPTSPVWWLYRTPSVQTKPQFQNYTVTYDSQLLPEIPKNLPVFTPPKPKPTISAWLLVISISFSGALFVWLLIRWRKISGEVRRAEISERLMALANEVRQFAGIKSNPPVRLTTNTMSPAVCGLFRPVILIPQSLAENFSDEQLRAVLLHELIHLRRHDVWVNFLQSLLQIFYWWQPLVWLANARIRRVREEAVDDAVMLALRGAAETYAPTLLEVAKLALNRPLASLGLVGILESRSALRQRIERLLNFRAPKKAGLTLVSIFGIAAFTAVAVPMGGAPSLAEKQDSAKPTISVPAAVAQNTNLPSVFIEGSFYRMSDEGFKNLVSGLQFNQGRANENSWWSASPEKFSELLSSLHTSGFTLLQRPRIQTSSGITAQMYIGNITNGIDFDCTPMISGKSINLAVHGNVIDQNQNVISTNYFRANTSAEDTGGMVIRMNPADGLVASNLVAVIGVQFVKPQIHIKARFLEVPKGITIDMTNLETLRAQAGVKELAEPEVTTTSGRQTQMRATTIITVITNFAYRETSTNSYIFPQSDAVETGPVLDTIATVLDDGYTIDLRAIASTTEFLGYDTPPTNAVGKYIKEADIHLPIILPRFSVEQSSSHLKLRDDQTVAMGLFPTHHIQSLNEKFPDRLGRLYQTQSERESEKEFIVFVTATLVDSAGNRIHPDN